MATAEGTSLSFYINDNLVWSGADGDLSAGRIGLAGYSDSSDPTTHYFDDVFAGEPGTLPTTMGLEQQWYNERAYELDGLVPAVAPTGVPR